MVTRKSSRLGAKGVASQLTIEKAQGSRNSKKRKTSHEKDDNAVALKLNRRRIKRKRDSIFTKDIPLEVLIEIFSLLEPVDLLHLTRVSKSLHDLLSSNDIIFLWKLVYKNIAEGPQPPPCPDDINIVFYTNYLYGRHCQFCCSIHGRFYHNSALVRLCSKCVDNIFLSIGGLDSSISCLCNASPVPKYKNASLILKAEYDLRTKEFKHACKKKKAASYSRDRKVDIQNRASFSWHLANWREEIQTLQLLKLKSIRVTREADIRKKLEEEGYQDDFDLSSSEVYRIPHVRKSHALTDSEWNIIRADILDYFQDFRDGQALYDMQFNLLTHVDRLKAFIHQWKIHPTARWIIASSEPIASFIKSQLQEGVSTGDFEKFKPQLRDLIASWKEEVDRYFASLISDKGEQKNSRKSKTNPLELATTFFKCHDCTESISYPPILIHDCFIFEDGESRNEEDDKGGSKKVVHPRGPREPRPPKHITPDMVLPLLSSSHSLGMYAGREGVTFDEAALKASWDIITACGEDPNTATHEKMNQTKAKLKCLRCKRVRSNHETGSTRRVMTWTMALVHELEEHNGEFSSVSVWRKMEIVKKTNKKVQKC